MVERQLVYIRKLKDASIKLKPYFQGFFDNIGKKRLLDYEQRLFTDRDLTHIAGLECEIDR